MKRLFISVILLLISVAFCFFSYFQLKNITSELNNALTECTQNLQSENTEKANQSIEKINEIWKNKKLYFKILIDGCFYETIDNCVNSLIFCFEEEEISEAKNNINNCSNALRQVIENERLSFDVIM